MNIFAKYFNEFVESINKAEINDYDELIDLMKSKLVANEKNNNGNAIIILGFSGNGKSTWIRNFCQENPTYTSISWDNEICKYGTLHGKTYREIKREEHVEIFGTALENLLKDGKNIVLDGNFLNLPLRIAIINTLHEYGYQATVVDLTTAINKTLPYRISDEIKRYRSMHPYDKMPINDVVNIVTNRILEFKASEERRSSFDLQQSNGVVNLGADRYFDNTISNKDIVASYIIRK